MTVAVRPPEKGVAPFSIRGALVLAGFAGICLSMAMGIALLLWPVAVPGLARLAHAHLAFAGGVVPMIAGAMLYFLPPLLRVPFREDWTTALIAVLLIGAPIAMTLALLVGSVPLMGLGGVLILAGLLIMGWRVAVIAWRSLGPLDLNSRFYVTALLFLSAAVLFGVTMAASPLTAIALGVSHGAVRLAHIHLALAGFVGMTVIGTMHNLFPTVLGRPLAHPALARHTFLAYSTGILVLAVSFLGDLPWGRRAAALLVLLSAGMLFVNVSRTAGRDPGRNAPAAHLLLGAGYFFVWVSVEAVNEFLAIHGKVIPHVLAGITHLGLLGWLVQTIIGAASFILPVLLLTGGSAHPDLGVMAVKMPAMRKILQKGAVWRVAVFNAGVLVLFAGWFLSKDPNPVSVLGVLLVVGVAVHFLMAVVRVVRLARREK